jgi:hypothetical protein
MPFSRDTNPDARRVLIERLRTLTPAQRLAAALEMTEPLSILVAAGVARDLPNGTPDERHALFLRRWLGRHIADEVVRERLGSMRAPPDAPHDRA